MHQRRCRHRAWKTLIAAVAFVAINVSADDSMEIKAGGVTTTVPFIAPPRTVAAFLTDSASVSMVKPGARHEYDGKTHYYLAISLSCSDYLGRTYYSASAWNFATNQFADTEPGVGYIGLLSFFWIQQNPGHFETANRPVESLTRYVMDAGGFMQQSAKFSDEYTTEHLVRDTEAKPFNYTGALGIDGQTSAQRVFSPDESSYSVSKLKYKIKTVDGYAGTVAWLEVFDPADQSQPDEYRIMSWQIPPGVTESMEYTIDPIDPANYFKHPTTSGTYRLQMLDQALAVDADRDGTIKLASEDASDATTAEKPFRFWINDDIDVLVESTIESEEDDRDPDSFLTIVNWESNFISSHRDLEDFARIWINTQGISDALKPKDDGTADLYLGLRWSDTEGTTPAIKLYKHVEVEGGTEYLNNPDVAQPQVNGALAIFDTSGQRTNRLVDGTTPYILPPSLFSDLSAAKTKTYLLFEGCKVGKGQLKLVILDKNKQPIGEGPGVWMDLKEPKEFIRRWTCGDDDLGSVNPVALDASKSGAFLPPTTDEEKDLILYVHGYNMQEFLKQRWIETTYKRLYWLGYKGRVGGFTWPCAQSALPFDASEENAYKAGAQLHALLNTLKNDGYRVHLLGHSQGNVVVGEALRQAGPDSAVAATYIASQAAIPAHCYDAAQPERSGPVAFVPTTANVYQSFYTGAEGENPNLPKTWSADDPAYLAQSQLNGSAGKFVNFFNPQDYALSGNGLNLLAADGSQPGWLADQRLKPNLGWHYNDNEGFYQMTGPAQSPTITYLSAANPTQRYQIFAYGAQARSLALGASFGIGGLFASNVNLTGAPFNFRNQHIYHSGQFRSFYAQRWQYWRQLLLSCRLPVRTTP